MYLPFVPINNVLYPANYRHKFPSGAKGAFTILEVALAATVLAFALTTAISVMQRAFLAMDTARGLTYAAQIMQHEVEKMRSTPWGDGASGAGSGTTGVSAFSTTPDTAVTIDNSFSSIPYIGSRFIMTRTVTTVHTAPGTGSVPRRDLLKVALTISWRTSDRRLLSRSFVAYYGQNGLYDFISA
jgi:Tfp pilus assembly protein PilV